jgi:hypothetical protein
MITRIAVAAFLLAFLIGFVLVEKLGATSVIMGADTWVPCGIRGRNHSM